MTELETIIAWIASTIPSILAIISVIITRIQKIAAENKILEHVKQLQSEVRDSQAYKELIEEFKGAYKIVLQENAELKELINELLTKMDHIERK